MFCKKKFGAVCVTPKNNALKKKRFVGLGFSRVPHWVGPLDLERNLDFSSWLLEAAQRMLINVAFRFPYLCFKNGGGAFLIPYFLLIITGSVPMYYLEIIMGQYTRSGAIKIWDVCPIFRGVGIGIIILNMFVNVYFIILMVWPMHFMFASIYAWFAPLFGYGKSLSCINVHWIPQVT